MKKKEKEKAPIQIKLKTEFCLAHKENAQNVAFALSSAGFFVRIRRDQEFYQVLVYTNF